MRVLDLSRALSGPFCGLILGDLGADVIKVEAIPDGDMIRAWGPFDRDESVYYLCGNRNKRDIGINFRCEEGRRLLREMALRCDVIIENFRPGTLAQMGLEPAGLRAEKPELIIASLSGFGSDGPLASRPGFDQIAQGYAGFMSFTGTPETGPTRVGVAIGDMTSGMWLAIGVLAAWAQRQQTGVGRVIETSLLSSLVSLLSVQGQRYLNLGEVAVPTGNVHPVIAPYGVFRAQDGNLNIGAATQDMWLSLCDVIGLAGLKDDERFTDNAGRMAHREELRLIIEERLATRTRADWTERLVEAGIPAGPINRIDDVVADAQVAHLDLIESFEHPTLGPMRQISSPLRMDGHDGRWIRKPPPVLGQHSRAILTDLGFSADEIAHWEETRVVYQNPHGSNYRDGREKVA
ncbi:CaiB/BaiF CoA transferase family protein [Azospirillum agricola]|uniref:CaiB/BaiF CoA transferase family protein n=1 Tax=Azospirillum agricola TaxID=1720247 RepID=UPI000A1C8F6D|nr:CaiB/BaiF CoA-transferase family protein [Azospirillum agricola]